MLLSGAHLSRPEFPDLHIVVIAKRGCLCAHGLARAARQALPGWRIDQARAIDAALTLLEQTPAVLPVIGVSALEHAWWPKLVDLIRSRAGRPALIVTNLQNPHVLRALASIRFLSIFDLVTDGEGNLQRAFGQMADGRRYTSPAVAAVVGGLKAPPLEKILSGIEQHILCMIGIMLHDDEIAPLLGLSIEAVRKHWVRIAPKLDVSGREALLEAAWRYGYATPLPDGSVVPGLVYLLGREARFPGLISDIVMARKEMPWGAPKPRM